jgi:superfamily II DNA/RNA helicase
MLPSSTAIGEEGLDIGEVDLIVNFDTIGSATRMVQRVGRTGRKRSGRVVGLVSEGAEERQLAKAKQSGRNLAHALRNPTSFQVLPTIPLLHSTPTLLEQNMQISQRFRMSQVEGHGGAGAGDSGKTSGSEPRKSLAWRLSDDAETRRAAVMGSSNSVCLPKSDGFPRELKKRFLTARLHQSNHGKKLSRRLGRVSSILMAFDSETRVGVIDRFGKKRRRALNATESYVDVVFPLSSSNEENFKMAAWGSAVERRKCKPPVEASSHQRENSAQVDTKSTCNDVKRKTKPPVKVISQQREKLAQVETRPTCNGVLESRRETMGEPTRNKVNSRDRKKPVQVGADVSFSGREANSTKGDEAPWKVNACERENSARAMEDSRVHASLSSNNEGGGILPVTSNESIHSQYCARTLEAVNKVGENRSRQAESSRKEHIPPTGQVSNEEWMLPTPPSSSDEESMSVESKRVAPKVIPDLTAKRTATLPSIPVDTFSLPSQDSSSDEGTFSLPSQDSSSDESDPNEKLHAVVPAHQASKGVFPAQRTVNDSNGILAEGEKASAQPRNARERTTQTMTYVPECGRLIGRRSVAKGDNEDGPVRTKPRKLRRAIEDSQESPAVGPSNENLKFRQKGRTTRKFIDDESSPGSFDRRSSTGTKSVARSDQLVDTQVSPTSDENVDDIVCAICSSGESPDEDPIVLCDGPGGTVTCNVAVHASCYAASIDFTKNEDWRCEVCEYKVGGGTIKPRCYICHEGSGALTRFFGNEWIHPACKSVAAAEQGGKPEGQSRDIGHSNEHTRKRRRLAVRATRKRNYESFFDEEARIASDEDVDGDEGDEEHIRDIEEEEEFYGGFINDSSQLDFTQDALDKVDPEEEGGHRALDATRARANVFATPVLNRQVRQPAGARWSDAHSSAPSSLRGLGQMRFIRSVLEHHREGGEADEIEEAFRRLEGQGTPADEAAVRPLPPEVERKVVVYHESDSDE